MAMKKKKAKKKTSTKATRSRVKAPKFLTLKQFKVLAEATRRHRISAARTRKAPSAPASPPIDLSKGFDPYEDD